MNRIKMLSAHRTKPDTSPMARPANDPRPVQHARIDIAAQQVGAEPVIRGRQAGPLGRRERGGVDGAEPRRKNPDQDETQQQSAADRDRRMAAQESKHAAPDRHRHHQVRQLRRDDEARRQRYRARWGDAQQAQ
jgi:hypothetical protein